MPEREFKFSDLKISMRSGQTINCRHETGDLIINSDYVFFQTDVSHGTAFQCCAIPMELISNVWFDKA